MKKHLALYISLAGVGLVSFLSALFLPISETAKTITGLPFVGALFAALFQLMRDHSTFVKEAEHQRREHAFTIAATSHMSEVVFDKHVEFSEAYVEKLHKLLEKLIPSGPTGEDLELVRPLYAVRKEYRLWISSSMAAVLDEFERKIVKMGSDYHVWEVTGGSSKSLERAYELFHEIIGADEAKDENKPEIEIKKRQSYNHVIEHLQGILGLDKLINLRDRAISGTHRSDNN